MPDEFFIFEARYLFTNRVFYNSVAVCWQFIGAFSLGDLRGFMHEKDKYNNSYLPHSLPVWIYIDKTQFL